MIIVLFTLVEEVESLFLVSPNLFPNPYRNLVDLYCDGMDNVLESINGTWGETYDPTPDPDWPSSLSNPDWGSPYDPAQNTGLYIAGTYYPSFDGYENLLVDPIAVNGFNIALSFNPSSPTSLADIDPNNNLLTSTGPLSQAYYVFRTVNDFFAANFSAYNINTDSYRIFTTAFNTTSAYPASPPSPAQSLYTYWVNTICSTPVSSTYNESYRTTALLALSILQGAYNYWYRVYQDCMSSSSPTNPDVSNGYTFISNILSVYNGTTPPPTTAETITAFANTLDWRQVIQQSVKAALMVLVNSTEGSTYQLKMSDQSFMIPAVTAAISSGSRIFGDVVVVGISSLGDTVGGEDELAPASTVTNVGAGTTIKSSTPVVPVKKPLSKTHSLHITAQKILATPGAAVVGSNGTTK